MKCWVQYRIIQGRELAVLNAVSDLKPSVFLFSDCFNATSERYKFSGLEMNRPSCQIHWKVWFTTFKCITGRKRWDVICLTQCISWTEEFVSLIIGWNREPLEVLARRYRQIWSHSAKLTVFTLFCFLLEGLRTIFHYVFENVISTFIQICLSIVMNNAS